MTTELATSRTPANAAITTASRLRVAAIVDTVIVSGPGRQVAALQAPLRAQGIDLHIVLLHRRGRPRSPYERFLQERSIMHTVVESGGPLDAALLTAAAGVLRTLEPHIVQTHGYRPTAIAFALSAMDPRWAWISFFHGETSENLKVRFYHALDKTLSRRAHRRVVMSAAQQARLGPRDPDMMVLHNAILPVEPVSRGSELDAVLRTVDAAPRPRLAYVGRLSPEKGVDVMLRAIALLQRDGLACSGLVVGDGPERASLESLCQELGIGEQVWFTGHIASADEVYGRVDAVVMPSRSEGLPNTLLEAMRADRPTVATAVGGIPEVVGSSAAAILVAPESPAALADGIRRVLETGHSPEARSARAAVCLAFSLERRVASLVTLYGSLSARKHG